MLLTAGHRIGSYEIVSALGAGGMGEVYRARDTKLRRDVALKILPAPFAHDADRLARFRREAEALAALNHPNIAAIYGLDDSSGTPALVLELVEGTTLAERIAKGALAWDEVWPLARQMTEALATAHDKGIVHRDLKPANIKVTAAGVVKVLDFGLAKVFAAQPELHDISQSPTVMADHGTLAGSAGLILGTAAYMSPEQARGKPVDARTDVWAFGCVLYEMLTGRPAFAGETLTDILGAIVTHDPDWTALPRETPSAIRRLLRRCLAKDSNERLHAIADARFDIAEAHTESGGVAPTALTPPVAAPPKRSRLPWAIAAATSVAALALAVPAAWYFRAARAAPALAPEMRLEVNTPSTTDPISFALSPDGRRLVFAASKGGTARLWLRSLDTMTERPLTGTESGGFPFWSPDSRSIAFFSGGKLKRVGVEGGSPEVLADASTGRGGTWNADGVILFGHSQGSGLLRVPSSGGEVVPATQLAPRQTSHRFPHFLPDGHRFLYFVQGPGDVQGIYLGGLDSPKTARLATADIAAAFLPTGHLVYVRQGALVAQPVDLTAGATTGDPIRVADVVGQDPVFGVGAFSISRAGIIAHRVGGPGRRQMTWFDRTGRIVGTIGQPSENTPNYPGLSPDGKRVVFESITGNNRDIWVADVARGVPTRFTSYIGVDQAPMWSSDGRQIVFRSNRNGSNDLFQRSSTSDTDESVLLQSPENKTALDWSSDGRFLLYAVQDPKTLNDIWVVPLTGDRKPSPFLQTPFDEAQGQFSPDGRFVAYQSNETGALEVYVRPFPGPGRAEPISTAGGASPRWRHDGRELFYVTPDDKVMAVTISRQGTSLDVGTPATLFRPRLASGPWGTATGTLRPQYDVSDDGRFLMNVTVEETVSPITLILNWKPR